MVDGLVKSSRFFPHLDFTLGADGREAARGRSDVARSVNACSSKRRMASGRVGASACLRIHASSLLSVFGCKRTMTGSPCPVAGRPLFFGIIICCLMLLLMIP